VPHGVAPRMVGRYCEGPGMVLAWFQGWLGVVPGMAWRGSRDGLAWV